MAYIVMAYNNLGVIFKVSTYLAMAYVAMAYVGMAYVGMAYI